MALLDSLPPVFFELLTPWLSAYELQSLWFTGCKHVIDALTSPQTISELRLELRRRGTYFPKLSLLDSAAHLRVLALTSSERGFKASLKNYHRDYFPTTLTSIELNGVFASIPFSSEYDSSTLATDLNVRFPNLKRLKIIDSCGFNWIGGDMRSLPRTLDSLEFQTLVIRPMFDMSTLASLTRLKVSGKISLDTRAVEESALYDIRQKLPKNLKVIECPDDDHFLAFVFGSSPSTTSFEDISLPFPNLKHLSNLNIQGTTMFFESAMKRLPEDIDSLFLSSLTLTEQEARYIPRLLRSLTLKTVPQDSNRLIASLPPHLTSLTIIGLPSSLAKQFQDLPTLTKLHIAIISGFGENVIFKDNIASLPHSITHLHIHSHGIFEDGWFGVLPPNLRTLQLRGDFQTIDEIKLLPQSLQDLTIPTDIRLTGEFIAALPTRLTSLDVRDALKIDGDSKSSFPSTLTRFSAPDLTEFSPKNMLLFPRSLSELFIPRCKDFHKSSPFF